MVECESVGRLLLLSSRSGSSTASPLEDVHVSGAERDLDESIRLGGLILSQLGVEDCSNEARLDVSERSGNSVVQSSGQGYKGSVPRSQSVPRPEDGVTTREPSEGVRKTSCVKSSAVKTELVVS